MIPIPYRWAAFATSLAACYGIGYTQARHRAEVERAGVEAVAVAESQRRQQVEAEVKDAQAGHLAAWTVERKRADDWWMRYKAAVARGVPAIPTVCASSGDAPHPGLEGVGETLTAGEAADALAAGEALEDTLRLCQTELRQCAGVR